MALVVGLRPSMLLMVLKIAVGSVRTSRVLAYSRQLSRFALLIAREGRSAELKQTLTELPKRAAYAGSRVVEYRLDRKGLRVFTK